MRITTLWTCSFLLIVTACPEVAEIEEEQTAQVVSDIPVSRVVLYRSGIAYVERSGLVDDDTLVLQIRPDQINDILATLTVIVDGGENIASSVDLPIVREVAEDLDLLPHQVTENGGMSALLQTFRGAEIEMVVADSTVVGRLVGTETLTNSDGHPVQWVTLITEDGDLRQYRVAEVISVQLRNETLQVGLDTSLDISLGEGDWKPVELSLHLSGSPPHDVLVSYVVSMPTWKPTYRIILDDDELYLQGWSVVDNISGEDWIDIGLSLVAGTPISFEYDLHTPRFVERPDLTSRGFGDESTFLVPEVDSGSLAHATPQMEEILLPYSGYGDTVSEEEPSELWSSSDRGEYRYNRDDDYDYDGSSPYREVDENEETGWTAASSVDSQQMVDSLISRVNTERLDNLFRYDIEEPLTIPDRSSALVTVLNEPIEGEDVLYFDPYTSPESATVPYRAIHLLNTSIFTVERGPLSIYKDGTFVGQAIAPRIGPGERIFLPYSLDGRFRVEERESTGDEGLSLVSIADGIIVSEVQHINQRTYQITNNSQESATLFVRIEKRTNWFLLSPDPEEGEVIDQGEVWYVPFELTGGQSQEFTIEEATQVERSLEIWSDIAADTVALYVSNPDADPDLAETLRTILEQRRTMAENEREEQRLRGMRSDVYDRMREVRLNLEILNDSHASRSLRRDLEERLGELEEDATELTEQIVTLDEECGQLQALISTTMMDLTLEPVAEEEEGEAVMNEFP